MATTPQLPNPATAKNPTTTLNGVTYYLRTGAGATPTWLRIGTGNKLYPVDLTGKLVAGKPAVFNTEAEWAKSVNTAIQPKPTVASTGSTIGATSLTPAQQAAGVAGLKVPAPVAPVAPATTAPTTPTTEQYGGVTPPSRLNLPDATTALSKIITNAKDAPPTMKTDSATGTAFYLAPPNGKIPAMWVAVPKGSTVASNGQSLQALQTAQTSYINPKQITPAEAQAQAQQAAVNAQREAQYGALVPVAPSTGATKTSPEAARQQALLIAEQNAQAQAAYEAAEAQRKQAEQAAQTQAANTQLIRDLEAKLPAVKSTAELTAIQDQAKQAGVTLNQGLVDRATLIAQQQDQRLANLRQTEINNQFFPQLREAKTQEDFDRVLAEVKAAGATLPADTVKTYQTNLTQNLNIQRQQAQEAKRQTLENEIYAGVNTQADLDRIQAQAKAEGITLSEQAVNRANAAIEQRNQYFNEISAFTKEQSLPTQGVTRLYTTNSGAEIFALPDDPVTGTKGGFYTMSGGGYQKLDQDGRPTGSIIPNQQFNELKNTTDQNVTVYLQQQKAEAEATRMREAVAKFESELPQPGSEKFNYYYANRYIATGPDGRDYEIAPGDFRSGDRQLKWIVSTSNNPRYSQAEGTYTELGNPDKVFTKGQVNQQYAANAQYLNEVAQAERAALIARQQAEANDFGPFDEILYVALGALAIGAIAGAAGGSLGSLFGGAAEGAALTGESMALAGEAATTAATMAEAGAGAAEIAGVIEGSLGLPAQVAGEMASMATGAVSGAIPVAEIASITTPEILAVANATADPLAAWVAQTGVTAVDMSYLASIGMPEAVMAAAAATNAALGAPTTIAEWAAATGGETVAGGAGAGAGGGGPVAPGAAVDTSQMIPAYDAAGNVGYMDPATGNFYSESGQLISEGSGGFGGGGTQYAGVDTGAVTDVGAGSATGGGPGETITQIFDDGSQLITDAAGNPVGGLDSAGNPFSVNPETGAGFYPETGLPTAGAGGGGGGVPGAVTGGEAPVLPTESSGISNITDAQFVAEDAAQLAKQGLSQSQIESTLLFSGVDPLVAADAAALASSGLSAGAIAPALEQSGAAAVAGGAPEIFTSIPGGIAEPLPGYGGPPGSAPIYGTNTPPPVYDYSVPYVAGNEPTLAEGLKSLAGAVKETLPTIGVSDVLAGIGAATVLGPVLAPQPPKLEEYQYGPLPPINWGTTGKVNLPGVNPGQVVAPKTYQTTSPVQSQFYWGQRPYQAGETFSPELYNQVAAPVKPWGLQQAFFETPQSYDPYAPFRPYGPDLTLQQPLVTTYQPTLPVVPQTQG